jgi:hypothetical protein
MLWNERDLLNPKAEIRTIKHSRALTRSCKLKDEIRSQKSLNERLRIEDGRLRNTNFSPET